jgi:hypothetical protein
MRLDSQLAFVPSSLSMVAAAGVDVPSTNVIDFLGSGVGTDPSNIIGTPTLFAEDPGVGGGFTVPTLQVTTGTAFTTGTAATLNVAIQYAADDGTGNPSTWYTAAETGEIPVANLGRRSGDRAARHAADAAAARHGRALHARLLFQIPAGVFFTAGTIAYAGIVPVRDDQANKSGGQEFHGRLAHPGA